MIDPLRDKYGVSDTEIEDDEDIGDHLAAKAYLKVDEHREVLKKFLTLCQYAKDELGIRGRSGVIRYCIEQAYEYNRDTMTEKYDRLDELDKLDAKLKNDRGRYRGR